MQALEQRPTGLAKWFKDALSTEDWWAMWIGLFFVLLGLIQAFTGVDITGWHVDFQKWVAFDFGKIVTGDHKGLMPGWAALLLSYAVYSVVLCIGARFMKKPLGKFFLSWSAVFWLTVIIFIFSRNAYIQGTALDREKFGIPWSLSIGGAHYIICLIVGLLIANLAPAKIRGFFGTAATPEWFIKIAIVCLGTKLGLKAIAATGFAFDLLIVGCCATIAAYLLFWPLVYTFARKVFKITREWAATLASGISICGVSASIATGGSIKSRPVVPIMISALIVVFAVFELVALPAILTYSPWHEEPMAAGASLGLTVKTDGADAASGEITDQLMRSRALEEEGIQYEEGWITSAAVMTKIWIDMFIGIWAFVLAVLWLYNVEKRPGEKVERMQIWWRFPKFVVGYFIAWFVIMALGLTVVAGDTMHWAIHPQESSMRHFFFALTFTAIGLSTRFAVLKQEGMGRLALVYGISLLIIIIPIGWAIAWLFHHGMMPPTVG